MRLLDIVHPAAKTLVDIARSQDEEIGDGTTTVVLTAGELLKASKQFIEDGVHSQIIIKVCSLPPPPPSSAWLSCPAGYGVNMLHCRFAGVSCTAPHPLPRRACARPPPWPSPA